MGPSVQNRELESAPTGILAALPEELGRWGEGQERERHGLRMIASSSDGLPVLACVAGVGKVHAARAASLLLAEGIGRLLVVGTCGGLRSHLGPGEFLHCSRAVQTDLALREGREIDPDPQLLRAWQEEVPGRSGWFLTADRPVMSLWRRLRLIRAFSGDCVAEMETAAAARVASAAGVPWAALRAVTDRAGHLTPASFRLHYPVQAPRAADTVPGLLRRLAELPPRTSRR